MNFSIVYKQKRADHNSRLLICKRSLHHHRFLAVVAEGEHKPSVVVDGDAVNDCVETAITPFGVKDIILFDLKEESAEYIRFVFLFGSLPCKSRITLLQSLVSFGKALIVFCIFQLVKSRYRIGGYGIFYHMRHDFKFLIQHLQFRIDFGVVGEAALISLPSSNKASRFFKSRLNATMVYSLRASSVRCGVAHFSLPLNL